MKKHILFTIAIFFLFACSKDSSEKEFGLLHKIESFYEGGKIKSTEIVYRADKRIQKLIIDQIGYSLLTYTITFENEVATALNLNIDYYPATNYTDQEVDYAITNANGNITLTPINDTPDGKIVIETTGDYIDSYSVYYGENEEYFMQELYTRNSENNIVSSALYDTNQSGSNIFVWQDNFLNFEPNVNLEPVHNPIFELLDLNIITALNLKISNQNPTNSDKSITNRPITENYRIIDFNKITNEFVEEFTMLYYENSYKYDIKYY